MRRHVGECDYFAGHGKSRRRARAGIRARASVVERCRHGAAGVQSRIARTAAHGIHGGNAEVKFVVQGSSAIYPVEVKAGINTQAKSLKVFCNRYSPPFAVRTSLAPHSGGTLIKDVPLPVFAPALRALIGG